MANRAERRARNKGGVPEQYDATQGRGRSGMIDEYQLQEKSRRLKEGKTGPWKPTSSELEHAEKVAMDTDPNDFDPPQVIRAPHSVRQWFRVASWVVIVVSAIMFFVVMWLPQHPLWSIITVSACFAAGVLSLFFTAGDPKNNPNLDQNGTAV
ncbi:tripartite tricarboxylate transporter TctB family protein [uncultured Bifidobacterium sp.]|uniref:tripartite tricarboxylate transporter TctB family protein n=1 Tax=uncultured Bifidobacterium sp. TaxID=165187 RepID=UPI00258B477B|nr:tripartite tricarboxylate transporter TctB family protein [uncultured Bifidobacterium sp.]MEE0654965.1 tripartite tricarboxylate transporter TctB family protein [Bifidobacterium criceti]